MAKLIEDHKFSERELAHIIEINQQLSEHQAN